MNHDLIIIGAGPSGLALATALGAQGFRVAVVERQDRAALETPAPDGRDIALTHRARRVLESLGMWERFGEAGIASIRAAHVENGTSPFALQFDTRESGKGALGFLVANHVIRRAAFETALAHDGVELLAGETPQSVRVRGDAAEVRLESGRTLEASLVVAADSRFSGTRRALGIGADLLDFGRTVIVCRMRHERSHEGIARECFHYGRTLAVLPLNGDLSSIVLTMRADEAPALLAMTAEVFAADVERQFSGRLGSMELVGERHPYPLVAVYARRFAIARAVLVGDAAVGMHPVTAHGYNFGLYGVETLSGLLGTARERGRDLGAATLLERYAAEHRRVTRPIYLGTNALVQLFTDDRLPVRALRSAVLRVADLVKPIRTGISRQLTGTPRILPGA
ncbi:MAG: 5-demethoxyubiquinol-8 5-hydroxylase UbiM [Gammaproteobacteria bacterium]|nr:5-demethoxyubiquinol-8 5-hydroxylase UbiM [Gammaproteobacteria bacterium]